MIRREDARAFAMASMTFVVRRNALTFPQLAPGTRPIISMKIQAKSRVGHVVFAWYVSLYGRKKGSKLAATAAAAVRHALHTRGIVPMMES